MTAIFAHRANLSGPDPSTENTVAAIHAALRGGFGLETDLRRDPHQRFYVAHDPQPRTAENDLEAFARLFRQFPRNPVAMNVKELGYEGALVDLWHSGQLGDAAFYFDFELLEPQNPGRAQGLLRTLPGGDGVLCAARLSDRGESLAQCLAIPAGIVWADEFDSLWLTQDDVRAVHAAGRKFYAISPELHGFDEPTRVRRWTDFRRWGIDGLCTDYALSAREHFSE